MRSGHRIAKILIVDDYQPNILALRVTLESPEYEIFEAQSGEEALALCNSHEFALIVLDIQMPQIDGFETARSIKKTEFNSDTPIIFVTAIYKEDPFIRKGYEAGGIDYFGKPFDPEILKAKVNIYTELYMKTKRLEETNELLKSQDQIKILLDSIPIGLMIADIDGQVVSTNLKASQIWPHPEKTLTADDWVVARTLETGLPVKDEIVHIAHFDGSEMTLKNSAFPFRSKAGKVIGAVSVFQDAKAIRTEELDRKWQSCHDLLSS